MSEDEQWYTLADPGQLDSPALLVYPQRVMKNIDLLIGMAGGPSRLRPHVKTHKTIEASKMMMAAGIDKFKCATIAEAEMLGMCGATDVLLAYQLNGPKTERFIALIKACPKTAFSCLVDNPASAQELSARALTNGLRIPVYIDLNVGMDRTGISPGHAAMQLYEQACQLEGLETLGLHAYDGHIHDPDPEIRKKQGNEIFGTVEKMQKALEGKGHKKPKIVIGGSPTFPVYAQKDDVECSPGTFVFWDKGYQDMLPEQEFLPAALILSRVISLPGGNRICTDLGHKSIAAEKDLNHRFFFLNAPDLKPVGQSEEHLVLEAAEGHQLKVGDVLYVLPYHICPTCALYESAILVENGAQSGSWKIIARSRKISI